MESRDRSDRGPNPIDIHVGARIRMRRKLLGISQEKLAEQLGLTFQQVQKYERGANRVSASKLFEIARSLQSSVSYFFEGLNVAAGAEGFAEGDNSFVHDLVMTPEGLELAALFPRIKRQRVRRRVLDLVKALIEDEVEAEQ
jgi:transcriptional regulator with XRE-family HTH domain